MSAEGSEFDADAWTLADLPGAIGLCQAATPTTALAAAETVLAGCGAILAGDRTGRQRLFGLHEAAPAVLHGCPPVPIDTRSLAPETTWHLPSLAAGATANIDVTVPGARRGDFADASLDTSSIAFGLD